MERKTSLLRRRLRCGSGDDPTTVFFTLCLANPRGERQAVAKDSHVLHAIVANAVRRLSMFFEREGGWSVYFLCGKRQHVQSRCTAIRSLGAWMTAGLGQLKQGIHRQMRGEGSGPEALVGRVRDDREDLFTVSCKSVNKCVGGARGECPPPTQPGHDPLKLTAYYSHLKNTPPNHNERQAFILETLESAPLDPESTLAWGKWGRRCFEMQQTT